MRGAASRAALAALVVVAMCVAGARAFGVVDALEKQGGFAHVVFGDNDGAYDAQAWLVTDVDGVGGMNDVVAPFEYSGRDGKVLGMQVFNGSDAYRLVQWNENVDGWGRGLAHAACDFSGHGLRGDVTRVWQSGARVFVSVYHSSLHGGVDADWPHALSQTLFATNDPEQAGVFCADVDADGIDDVLVMVPHPKQFKIDVWWLLSTEQHLVESAVQSAVPLSEPQGDAVAWGAGLLTPSPGAPPEHVWAMVYHGGREHVVHALRFNATTHTATSAVEVSLGRSAVVGDAHVLMGSVCARDTLDVVAVSGEAVRYGSVFCGAEALATAHTSTLGELTPNAYVLGDVSADGLADVVAMWERDGAFVDVLAWESLGSSGGLANVTVWETPALWRAGATLLDAPEALVLPYTTHTPPHISPTPTPAPSPSPSPKPHKHGVPAGIVAAIVGGGLVLVCSLVFVIRYFRREPGLEGTPFVSIQ